MRELIQAYRKCYRLVQHKGTLWIDYLCQTILLGLSFIQPYVFALVIEYLAGSCDADVYQNIILIAILCIIKTVCSACVFFSNLRVEKDSRIYVKEKLLTHLLQLHPSNKQAQDSAKITETLYSDANNITTTVFSAFSVVCDIATVLVSSITIFSISPVLSLIMLVMLSITLLFSKKCSRELSKKNKALRECTDRHFKLVRDVILHMKAIKITNANTLFNLRYDEDLQRVKRRTVECSTISWKANAVGSIMENIDLILFLLIGSKMVLRGNMPLSAFILYSSYSKLFSSSVTRLFNLGANSQQLLVSVNRVFDVFAQRDEQPNDYKFSTIQKISVDNVTFAYDGRTNVFTDFSCVFEAGQSYALVGSNGSGKTTLLQLIGGILRPDDGTVLYDDMSLASISYQSIQNCVSFYIQEDVVYDMSLRDNLLLFDGGNNVPMAEVEALCATFGMLSDIQALPSGFDTILSEIQNMSFGQTRKIIMMRAFLKPAEIYLFDEPLAGIDAKSQHDIVSAIKTMSNDKIVVIATHRPELFNFVDKIISLSSF